MKELSIEQKAQRFDEAIKKARERYNKEYTSTLERSTLAHVFPELKESEDEKTMKEILDYIIKGSESLYDVQQYGKERFEKWIAWLEKQGEPKQEWSEEDELHIKELESLVKRVWAIGEHENDKDTIHKMSDLSFFLKTLKPQPKQEWSEEDEKHVNDLIAYFTADMSLKHTEEDIANWLKSLRPQPQWKPSDEQMEALGDINLTGNISYAGQGQELINLYNDLKKLKK